MANRYTLLKLRHSDQSPSRILCRIHVHSITMPNHRLQRTPALAPTRTRHTSFPDHPHTPTLTHNPHLTPHHQYLESTPAASNPDFNLSRTPYPLSASPKHLLIVETRPSTMTSTLPKKTTPRPIYPYPERRNSHPWHIENPLTTTRCRRKS